MSDLWVDSTSLNICCGTLCFKATHIYFLIVYSTVGEKHKTNSNEQRSGHWEDCCPFRGSRINGFPCFFQSLELWFLGVWLLGSIKHGILSSCCVLPRSNLSLSLPNSPSFIHFAAMGMKTRQSMHVNWVLCHKLYPHFLPSSQNSTWDYV